MLGGSISHVSIVRRTTPLFVVVFVASLIFPHLSSAHPRGASVATTKSLAALDSDIKCIALVNLLVMGDEARDLDDLRTVFPPGPDGISLFQMKQHLCAEGLAVRVVQPANGPIQLAPSQYAIAHANGDHFVVLFLESNEEIGVADPSDIVDYRKIAASLSGNYLLVEAKDKEVPSHAADGSARWRGALFPRGVQVDFGVVQRDSVLRGSFVLRNPYSHDMLLAQVASSCGCLEIDGFPRNIAPFDSNEVEFTFRVGRSAGEIVKHLIVQITEPHAIMQRIDVYARVSGGTLISPPQLQISAEQGAQIQRTVEVRGSYDMPEGANVPIRIDGATLDIECLDLEVTQVRSGFFRLTVSGVMASEGRTEGKIMLHTNDPQKSLHEIPLQVDVEPTVFPVPKEVILLPEKGKRPRGLAEVRSHMPIRIESCQVSSELFQVEHLQDSSESCRNLFAFSVAQEDSHQLPDLRGFADICFSFSRGGTGTVRIGLRTGQAPPYLQK